MIIKRVESSNGVIYPRQLSGVANQNQQWSGAATVWSRKSESTTVWSS